MDKKIIHLMIIVTTKYSFKGAVKKQAAPLILSYHSLPWHLSLIAQPWQPHEDFPCFLFFTIKAMIAATVPARTKHIIIVEILFKNHVIIQAPL